MEGPFQPALLEIPPQPEIPAAAEPEQPSPGRKIKAIDRSQSFWRAVIVEELVPANHKARAIWDLTGQLDLNRFLSRIRSHEGAAGRAAWDPRLLLSVWLYAYSEQVSSAREIERLMEYEPGLMWLAGLGLVNYHTLSSFRSANGEEFKKLLTELLGLLSQQGLVDLKLVAHDGTKVRAQAGADSFRREGTLAKEIATAQQMVEEIEQSEAEQEQGKLSRREAAQKRIAQERLKRMQEAAQQLEEIRATAESEQEWAEARVSLTEPEARRMKHGDNAIAPSYNVQLSTDAAHKIVVGVHLTQCSSDSGSLLPAMEEVKARVQQFPEQVVADGGFTNHKSIAQMKENEIEFYGSLPQPEVRQAAAMKAAGIDPAFSPAAFVIVQPKKSLQCPAGKTLTYVRGSKKRGSEYQQYRAEGNDCSQCEFRKQCCPNNASKGRTVSVRITEEGDVVEFREKMKREESKAIYRKRGAVAEFPHCWIKEKLGLRKFRLRGLAKAGAEALCAVLTYNVMQWMRLSWLPQRPVEASTA